MIPTETASGVAIHLEHNKYTQASVLTVSVLVQIHTDILVYEFVSNGRKYVFVGDSDTDR